LPTFKIIAKLTSRDLMLRGVFAREQTLGTGIRAASAIPASISPAEGKEAYSQVSIQLPPDGHAKLSLLYTRGITPSMVAQPKPTWSHLRLW